MLTREHALAVYDLETGRILPDRLTRRTHRRYVDYAERMLAIYRDGAGRTRRDLHRSVERVFQHEPDCPARRIAAFCKLLDDASIYHRDRRGRAAELRRRVFRMAAARHPLVTERDGLFEAEERNVKEEIAAQLGSSWPEIEGGLFGDVIEFHRLREFPGYPNAAALLARYNVAQVQAALYRATSLHVWASGDFKTILRYARLARLMFDIQRLDDGRFLFRFDGPASVLRRTRRYGAAMARFLPALMACRGWRMHAVVSGRTAAWSWRLELSDADGLRSHLPAPEEFDSSVEQAFSEQWGGVPARRLDDYSRRGAAHPRPEGLRPRLRLSARRRPPRAAGDRRLLDPRIPGSESRHAAAIPRGADPAGRRRATRRPGAGAGGRRHSIQNRAPGERRAGAIEADAGSRSNRVTICQSWMLRLPASPRGGRPG
jgi:uncharacterized protein